MRRINLLPPEERRRGLALPTGGLLPVLAGVGAVALVIMVVLYVITLVRLNNEEERIARLDEQIAAQNQQIAALQPYQDLQDRLDAKQPVADGIYRSRFAWHVFLQNLGRVIPASAALDSFTAQASPVNVEASPGQPLEPSGSITFTGVTLPRYQNVADVMVQLNTLETLTNTRLNSAELDRETFAQPTINFEVDSELITQASDDGVRIDGAGDSASGFQAQGEVFPEEGG